MIRLRLDHHSGEPIWRQIVEQVKYAIAAGRIESGSQLPSIRALAAELAINPRTVVKAYEELAHMGLVVMRHGQGVFVSQTQVETSAGTRRRVLEDLCRRLLAEASRLGADPEEVTKMIERIAMEMRHE